jgi:acyl-coenzyme A thioesterase PaaI-like protein
MTTNTNTADTDRIRRQALDRHRRETHAGCVVCDPSNGQGLNLRCEPDGDGRVTARFRADAWMAGFPGRVHGGIVSMLFDGAMSQCLFAHDIVAVTAVMHLRFRRPVPLDSELHVSAWIEHSDATRYELKAELRHDGRVLAEAEALFTPQPDEN